MFIGLPLALGIIAIALNKSAQRDRKVSSRADTERRKRARKVKALARKKTTRDAANQFAKKVNRKRVQAAKKLVRLSRRNKATPDRVKPLQQAMGAIPLTGKLDARTRLRVVELLGHGVKWGARGEPKAEKKRTGPPDYLADLFDVPALPAKPVPYQVPRPAPESKRLPAPAPAEPARKKARQRPAPGSRRRPGRPAPAPAPESKRLPAPAPAPEKMLPEQEAALGLYSYLNQNGTDRGRIAEYQRNMKRLDPDGIPGSKTKARASSLLKKQVSWPAVIPTGPAPAPTDPTAAANELANYLTVYQGDRRDRIKAYQAAMGGLTADGLAGPKTKARIEQLTGRRV